MCSRCRGSGGVEWASRVLRHGLLPAANCFQDRRKPIHGGYDGSIHAADIPENSFRRESVLRSSITPSDASAKWGGRWMQLRQRRRNTSASTRSIFLLTFSVLTIVGCHRENRYFEPPRGSDLAPSQLQLSPLVAGQSSLQFREQQKREYEENAYHVSEGKRLYNWFNCVGCHANGGGGSGPALMDDRWIYGGEIDQIYLTIVQGRPNGMPAFGGKVPSQQIWQLAAYVRSMGGHGPKAARPGRDDNIQKDSEQGRTDEPLRGAPSNENF